MTHDHTTTERDSAVGAPRKAIWETSADFDLGMVLKIGDDERMATHIACLLPDGSIRITSLADSRRQSRDSSAP